MAKRSPQLFDAQVGKNVKSARRSGGLSQPELGRRLGLSCQQIKKYESGETRIGASRLTQIAEVLQVPLPRLFGSGDKAEQDRAQIVQRADALVAKADALRLLRAFHKIEHRQVRLAVLQLIEAVGYMQEPRSRQRRESRFLD